MNSEQQPPAEGKPFWMAKSVWLAFALMALGAFLWVRDQNPRATRAGTGATLPGVTQFSDSSTAAVSNQSPASPSSPATFRFGASYLGGFFLGWMLRRFIKWTLLVLGAGICLAAIGHKFGWCELDWGWIEAHVRQSLMWVKGGADSFRTFITGLLPSAGAAVAGTFFGFRSK